MDHYFLSIACRDCVDGSDEDPNYCSKNQKHSHISVKKNLLENLIMTTTTTTTTTPLIATNSKSKMFIV